MRKVRRTLPIVLTVSVISGLLAVAGQAKKPALSVPIIQVVGGIMVLPEGTTTDPTNVRVAFVDSSFGALAGKSFPANADPDYSPGLHAVLMRVGPPDTQETWLRFRYCAHPSHQEGRGIDDRRCQDPEGHSAYYYCLNLHDAQTAGKGRGDLDHLTFPPGTSWSIGWKAAPDPSVPVAEGTLAIETTYDVIR
jgi:hypothetical protein